MSRVRSSTGREESGAILVVALLFLVVVGAFAIAALGRSEGGAMSGGTTYAKAQYQYALDGAVDRAWQVLRADIKGGNPTYCTSPSASTTALSAITEAAGSFALNGKSIDYSCQDLAGTTSPSNGHGNTDYSIVITGCSNTGTNAWGPAGCSTPGSDAFVTSGSTGNPSFSCTAPYPTGVIVVHGSVYLNTRERSSDVKNPTFVCGVTTADGYVGGDVVQSDSVCTSDGLGNAASLSTVAGTNGPLYVDSKGLVACTGQPLVQAIPNVDPNPVSGSNVLPPVPTTAGACVQVNPAKGTTQPCTGISHSGFSCQVYYPGIYTAAFLTTFLTGHGTADYFASGTYYFQGIGNWSGSQTTVIAGRAVNAGENGDTTGTGCDATGAPPATGPIGDAWASSHAPAGAGAVDPNGGVQWIFGGPSSLSVAGSSSYTLFDKPMADSTTPSLTVIAVPETGSGYVAYAPAAGGQFITMGSATSVLTINGKLIAPSASSMLFASNPNAAAVTGGVVMGSLTLKASNSAALQPSISTPIGPSGFSPPPFRSVRVVASDHTGKSSLVDCSVARIYNFTNQVAIMSWQTANSIVGGACR